MSRDEEFWKKDIACYKHNHLLKYLDIIKVNLNMKNTIAAEIWWRNHITCLTFQQFPTFLPIIHQPLIPDDKEYIQ